MDLSLDGLSGSTRLVKLWAKKNIFGMMEKLRLIQFRWVGYSYMLLNNTVLNY